MQSSMAELIHNWHDFYLLVGTASATLVGLMFVSASIGAHVFKEENRAAVQAFISPTVVHFSATLFACILGAMPAERWQTLAGLLALSGLAGIGYSARVLIELLVRRVFPVDMADRIFYALLPLIGHVLVVLSAVLLFDQSIWGLNVLAAALVILLFAGIRNAWDMTIWIVIRTPIP